MKEPLDVRMCDFDNVSYHVSVNPEAAGILNVSMTCGCWDQLKALGAEQQLQALYGDILVPADSSADVALRINLNEPVANPGLHCRRSCEVEFVFASRHVCPGTGLSAV